MPVEPALNTILKEMWRLDEKLLAGQRLEAEEMVFYNQHLATIQEYYDINNSYWQRKQTL